MTASTRLKCVPSNTPLDVAVRVIARGAFAPRVPRNRLREKEDAHGSEPNHSLPPLTGP